MSFVVFADGSANLPKQLSEGISLIPLDYTVDGQAMTYRGDIDSFDAHVQLMGIVSKKRFVRMRNDGRLSEFSASKP